MDSAEKLRVKSAHVNAEATRLLRLADQVTEMQRIVQCLRDPDASGQVIALTNGRYDVNARCDFTWLNAAQRESIAVIIEAQALHLIAKEDTDG